MKRVSGNYQVYFELEEYSDSTDDYYYYDYTTYSSSYGLQNYSFTIEDKSVVIPTLEAPSVIYTDNLNPISIDNIKSQISYSNGTLSLVDGYTANKNRGGSYNVYLTCTSSTNNVVNKTIVVIVKDIIPPKVSFSF